MKNYPSIPKFYNGLLGRQCICFYKYDGSQIRSKWSASKGWHLFGTRHRLFDKSDPEYGCAIDIFKNKYGDDLEKIIKTNKEFKNVREVICFSEFFGPYSFGGQHDINHPALKMVNAPHNDPKDVVLFDVNIHKKGMLSAKNFVTHFGHLDVAKIIYEGILDESLVCDIRTGKYPVFEGIIAKGGNGHEQWSVKIKTFKYLEELKKRFSKDWESYWE